MSLFGVGLAGIILLVGIAALAGGLLGAAALGVWLVVTRRRESR
jgi:hypothetical protein